MDGKSFLTGVAVTAPIFAVILMYVLQGREQTDIKQQAQEVRQQIEEAKFDSDFAQAWNGGKVEVPRNHRERIKALEAEERELKARSATTAEQDQADIKELRQALQQSANADR